MKINSVLLLTRQITQTMSAAESDNLNRQHPAAPVDPVAVPAASVPAASAPAASASAPDAPVDPVTVPDASAPAAAVVDPVPVPALAVSDPALAVPDPALAVHAPAASVAVDHVDPTAEQNYSNRCFDGLDMGAVPPLPQQQQQQQQHVIGDLIVVKQFCVYDDRFYPYHALADAKDTGVLHLSAFGFDLVVPGVLSNITPSINDDDDDIDESRRENGSDIGSRLSGVHGKPGQQSSSSSSSSSSAPLPKQSKRDTADPVLLPDYQVLSKTDVELRYAVDAETVYRNTITTCIYEMDIMCKTVEEFKDALHWDDTSGRLNLLQKNAFPGEDMKYDYNTYAQGMIVLFEMREIFGKTLIDTHITGRKETELGRVGIRMRALSSHGINSLEYRLAGIAQARFSDFMKTVIAKRRTREKQADSSSSSSSSPSKKRSSNHSSPSSVSSSQQRPSNQAKAPSSRRSVSLPPHGDSNNEQSNAPTIQQQQQQQQQSSSVPTLISSVVPVSANTARLNLDVIPETTAWKWVFRSDDSTEEEAEGRFDILSVHNAINHSFVNQTIRRETLRQTIDVFQCELSYFKLMFTKSFSSHDQTKLLIEQITREEKVDTSNMSTEHILNATVNMAQTLSSVRTAVQTMIASDADAHVDEVSAVVGELQDDDEASVNHPLFNESEDDVIQLCKFGYHRFAEFMERIILQHRQADGKLSNIPDISSTVLRTMRQQSARSRAVSSHPSSVSSPSSLYLPPPQQQPVMGMHRQIVMPVHESQTRPAPAKAVVSPSQQASKQQTSGAVTGGGTIIDRMKQLKNELVQQSNQSSKNNAAANAAGSVQSGSKLSNSATTNTAKKNTQPKQGWR